MRGGRDGPSLRLLPHRLRSLPAVAAALVVASSPACTCLGRVAVVDVFAPRPADASADSLHVYATDARVPLQARAVGAVDVEGLSVVVEGAGALDEDAPPEADDGALTFTVQTGDEPGDVLVRFFGANGEVDRRALEVVAPARMELSVTAAALDGVELPDVDEGGARIAQGGKAAFRALLFDDADDEVHGVGAVAAAPADDAIGARRTAGCAPTTCEAQRAAIELAVPADGGLDDVAVELTAGDAVETIVVVPTPVGAIDALTVAAEDDDDAADGDRRAVYARPTSGGEVVFGAPVAWTLDDEALEGAGDLAVYTRGGDGAKTLRATVGGVDGDVEVAVTTDGVDDVSVTSVTAACAQTTPSDAAVGAFALAALATARRRRVLQAQGASVRR